MNKSLLHTPEGVQDLYGKEYARKLSVQELIRQTVSSYGYEDIQTPTFEFFDVFSKEVGTTPSKELYKFFDKENNTLVLRPDFTPSIARCASKYFMDDTAPLRFTYSGSTFSNISSLQGKLCEFTEMGAELIGDDSVQADAEMIMLVIESLQSTGLTNFRVTVGEMDYFKGLCEEAGLDTTTEMQLREYVSGKNYFAVQELLSEIKIEEKYASALQRLADPFLDAGSLSEIKGTIKNSKSLNAIQRLEALYHVLELNHMEEYVSFDLSMLSKYNYYTGVIFRVYTYGVGNCIVKGGRYDNLLYHFGKNAAAIGFVILIDDLMEALRRQKVTVAIPEEVLHIVYDPQNESDYETKAAQAKELRKSGKRVALIPAK